MATSLPYMPVIGSLCTARRLLGTWRVISHTHDGLVYKCLIQCLETGEFTTRFNHEITELPSSTYADVNDFLQEVGGISEQEFNDIFNTSFELENIEIKENIPCTELHEDTAAVTKDTCKSESDFPMPSNRFKTTTAADVNQLKLQNTEKSTDRQTKWAVKLLREWMIEVGHHTSEFEYLSVADLDAMLQQFYAAVQTKSGKDYSKSALIGARAAINRHLTSPPISRNVNLMKDREFMSSNQVLSGLVKSLKREGKDISKHKEPICKADVTKLYESGVFAEDTAQTLQNKVMFEIISQFGRRGQEGLRNLKKHSFKTGVDAKGRKYVCMAYNEADKTHHGIDSRESEKNPRMYENGGNFCPFRSFEKYVSKLNPNLSDFFQKPLQNVTDEKNIWYANRAVGINTLSSFMTRMSDQAKLSVRYTNHCIRAHVSSTLHAQGFSSRAIMSVTGHRNVSSLTSYIKPSEDERERVSRALCPISPDKCETSCNTVSLCPTDEAITPPAPYSNSVESNIDVSVQGNKAMHMFTGNISNCTITMNVYNSK